VAEGTDALRVEIEDARRDLARDVRHLRTAAKELRARADRVRGQVVRAAGAAVAAYVAFRLVRAVWRRTHR
jgi:hypothetical protein